MKPINVVWGSLFLSVVAVVFAIIELPASNKRITALESAVTSLKTETFRLDVAATASRFDANPDLAIWGTVPPEGGIRVLVFPRNGYDWSRVKPSIEQTMNNVYRSHPEQLNVGVTFTVLEH